MIEAYKIELYNPHRKKICVLDNDSIQIKAGDYVIIEDDKGIDFGRVCSGVLTIDDTESKYRLYKIVRKATKKDIDCNCSNEKDSIKALKKAKELSQKLNLKMKFLNACFTFDRRQLILNFTAEDRVDFRELAKKLAAIYKTRIELRQIGVRDKAKEIGGLGPCGRFLCCNSFLNDFDSVSINMAKNQYLSLKPDKINGNCGRLLCCLKYEDDQYLEEKKKYPQIGTIIKYNNQKLKVTSLNLFKDSFVAESVEGLPQVIGLNDYESKK